MKYYQEITLLPDAETSVYFLWEKVYALLHLRLVELKNSEGKSPFGFSFPEYKPRFLGKKLRLFAPDEAMLESFALDDCLKSLRDYVHCTSVRAIPENIITGYVVFHRLQVKSNIERLLRRSIKNGKCSEQEAKLKLKNFTAQQTDLPYVQIKSSSSGERFRLFIKCSEVSQAETQSFNCYGLSKQSTVPIF